MAFQNKYFSLTTSGAGYSSIIQMPIGALSASVQVIPAGGSSAEIEYCLDNWETARAGSGTWKSWPNGAVSATADDACLYVTAFRLKQTGTGSATAKIVCTMAG